MSFSCPLNNYAHSSADQPRIATSARMRSGSHSFSGIGQLVHSEKNNHCVSFFLSNQVLIVQTTEEESESFFRRRVALNSALRGRLLR